MHGGLKNGGKNNNSVFKKSEFVLKSLKVFRLKAAILGLQFVNLVMFDCSLLSKTCMNVYRPISPILSLPCTSCKLTSSANQVQVKRTFSAWIMTIANFKGSEINYDNHADTTCKNHNNWTKIEGSRRSGSHALQKHIVK